MFLPFLFFFSHTLIIIKYKDETHVENRQERKRLLVELFGSDDESESEEEEQQVIII